MKNICLIVVSTATLCACSTLMNTTIQPTSQSNHTDVYPVESVLQKTYSDIDMSFVTEYDGMTINIAIKNEPKGLREFKAQSVEYSVAETDFTVDDVLISSFDSIFYYQIEPFEYKGAITADDRIYEVTETYEVPKFAKIGSSDIYAREVSQKSKNRSHILSSNTNQWSLTKASSDTAWLCDITDSSAISNYYDDTAKSCYEINHQGDILGGYAEIMDPFSNSGGLLKFKIVVDE